MARREGKGIAGWAGWALGLPSSQQDSVAILPSFVGWAGPLAALPSSRQKEGPRGSWLTCVRRPPPGDAKQDLSAKQDAKQDF